ncbi:cell wall elongation regulator TseB-like domain-containing protein [Bacillus sp. CHD6a]|uniref:cell wall elongation regulator TseB-like domain-containing protein n=1 Tax=Bacillus sp. CHD6a TaxID=1643452 RepID=UPI0006CD3FB0|nr:DUF5590 domain-containing protein [Bacillus sp. CHD6a]KPB06635.1 hypothetical protein AAV98_02305 [Bacillus sp. CHD6a]
MKKWIIFSIIMIAIIILWQFISIYQTAMSPVKDQMEKGVAVAQKGAELQTVEDVAAYNGTDSFVIVHGMDSKKEELVVWVKESKEIVRTMKKKDGIPREDVLNYLQTDREPKEIISISLAMEKNTPLWEIKYKDINDQYNLYFIKFENGEYFQRIIF